MKNPLRIKEKKNNIYSCGKCYEIIYERDLCKKNV